MKQRLKPMKPSRLVLWVGGTVCYAAGVIHVMGWWGQLLWVVVLGILGVSLLDISHFLCVTETEETGRVG